MNLKVGSGMELPANPMTLQPMDACGEAQLQPAFSAIEKASADRAFPGATLAVGYRGKLSVHAFGNLKYDAKSPEVKADTMYDIASLDRKSTRLNSSHQIISYAVFCLKKKKNDEK